MRINRVLCDLDGTLVDTMDLILASFHHAFEAGLGETVTDQELLVYFGQTLEDQFGRMRPHLGAEEIARLIAIYREHNHREHDARVFLVPGADLALEKLKHQGYDLGVVTSKRLDMAQHGLELFGLWPYFSVVVHQASTSQHKPHPAPILRALELWQTSAEHVVYVGDSPYDMMAAKAAGCLALGLAYNTFPADDLLKAGADSVHANWDSAVRWIMAAH